ncbi:MAG: DNA gyrase C-terminal beta-propeller domain-containing protein, partial [Candidatus Binatia bacterium]
FDETTRAGRKFARVAGGDEIVSLAPLGGKEIVCAAARGTMRRFPLKEVPELSGPGKGVYLMRPGGDDDRIVGAVCPPKDAKIVVVPAEGNERRLSLADVPAGKRAGKGLKVVKRGQIASIRMEE